MKDISLDELHLALYTFKFKSSEDDVFFGPWTVSGSNGQFSSPKFTVFFQGSPVLFAHVGAEFYSCGHKYIDLENCDGLPGQAFEMVCRTVKSVFANSRIAPKERTKIKTDLETKKILKNRKASNSRI